MRSPPAVTILGLVNDTARDVRLVVDAEVWSAPALPAHPLVNTATLVLSHRDVAKCSGLTGHDPVQVNVPVRTGG